MSENNQTLSELNDGPEAELQDPRCFIVSASYGSPFAAQVDLYRWFRDRVLLQSDLGIRFVDFYYNHSQPIADVINESPSLQLLMQLLLLVPTSCLYLLHAMGLSFWLCIIILGMAVVCAVSYQLRKKKALSSV